MLARDSCRIVVSGIGLCTPLGSCRESSWRGMIDGKSAVRWLQSPHWTEPTLMPGAPAVVPGRFQTESRETIVELALATAHEAVDDAKLNLKTCDPSRLGVVYGTSKGGLQTFSRMLRCRTKKDHSTSREATNLDRSDEWLDVLPNGAAVEIAKQIGAIGPVLCPIAACATGLVACLRAADLIQNGDCDVVLAGSSDASLQPALLGSFRRLGVLSREQVDPIRACRPFDVNRSGFAIGEGAACLVLERYDSAIQRDAKCYAEWLGGRMLSDPSGITQLDPNGTSLKRLLRDLLSISGRDPDYVNLHGTATTSNDLLECLAIREVFEDRADEISCSGLKGGLGHLLGAAGSVELAATILAIRDQVVPPTVNLFEVDPDCQLNLTPKTARYRDVDDAWKLSMGFGGHLAGACLRKLRP